MYLYLYIYIYIYIYMSKGWNSHVHRELPGNVESTNLSRDNLSREIRRVAVGSRSQRLTPNLTIIIHRMQQKHLQHAIVIPSYNM